MDPPAVARGPPRTLGGVRGVSRVKLALTRPAQRLRARRERRDWNRRLRRLYRHFVAPGELCFDVGANIGSRVAALLDIGAYVVAVEPQAHCADELRRRFGRTARAVVVESALGAAPGEAELLVTDYDTVSTLSREWVDRVRAAGRFHLDWKGSVTVPVTTLDALIARHGRPVFCKIDVEGYEPQVLGGLSEPIRTIAFEFTPEFGEAASACVERLLELGLTRFAFSAGESLELGAWMGADEMLAFLQAIPRDGRSFGDVYAGL